MDGGGPSWDLWRAFDAAIETRSLSAAARRLGATQPTLGRQIEALEVALGYPLFVRSQRGLTPTDAALALAPLAATMTATAGALARAGAGASTEAGVVRVTASEVIACEVIAPILPAFRAVNPEIEVEIDASNAVADLLSREADIAVRMVPPRQQALVARHLGTAEIGLYARADYLARHGMPTSLDDFAGHTIIGYDRDLVLLDQLRAIGIPVEPRSFAVRADNNLVQHALIRAGVGIGGMQHQLAARSPDLVAVLPDAFRLPLEIWVVMHEDLRGSKPVRALFDFLAAGLGTYLAS
jgi:DNA-binding transcriptional LysR family regulator